MKVRLKCEIKSRNLKKNVDNIIKLLPKTKEIAVENILKNIQGCSIKLERGHNEKGISVELIENSTGISKGRVVAKAEEFMTDSNISYLLFEYFGTGQHAEMEHIGRTKHFLETGYTEWYIPVNKVKRKLNYPILNIGGHDFYVAYGSKSNHFLSDAEFSTRNTNKKEFTKELKDIIEKSCK